MREINLIAQDSSHYGRDRGATRRRLPSLLEALDGVEGLRWIRVHYLYPNTVTDELIGAMARLPACVDYVDLPLQHARSGGAAPGCAAADPPRPTCGCSTRFRTAMPEPALRTTLIVGFPGETEEEFRALLEFVRESAVRSPRRLHLLPRGAHRRLCTPGRCAPAKSRRSAAPA